MVCFLLPFGLSKLFQGQNPRGLVFTSPGGSKVNKQITHLSAYPLVHACSDLYEECQALSQALSMALETCSRFLKNVVQRLPNPASILDRL